MHPRVRSRMGNRFRAACFLLGSLTATGSAWPQQQDNPLIGTWQLAIAETPSAPGAVRELTYAANGTMQSRLSFAPRQNMVGGTVLSSGTYRLTGPGTVVLSTQSGQACSTGGVCIACPGDSPACNMLQLGKEQTVNFQVVDANQIRDAGGNVWHRLR
jgi:hypothetical protein